MNRKSNIDINGAGKHNHDDVTHEMFHIGLVVINNNIIALLTDCPKQY